MLQQYSIVPGTWDHFFSDPFPSKKLWYLLVSISGALIHLNYDIQSCQVAVLLGSDNPEGKKKLKKIKRKKRRERKAKSINKNKCLATHSFQFDSSGLSEE